MAADTTRLFSARRAEWKLQHLHTTINYRTILTTFAC